MNNDEIREQALLFAKKNKIRLAKQLTDPAIYLPEEFPVSVFMAGSPGAGKTEFSKGIIKILEKDNGGHIVRIDGDEIRQLMPGYTGSNSRLFQGAISLVVEKMHDLLLHSRQSFILDSTFTKHEKAVSNIRRSLDHGRIILIFYVYQKPDIAWEFTKAREEKEGRNIPKDAFIEEFLSARDTVDRISREFGTKVMVYVVRKDYTTNAVESVDNMTLENKTIDHYIPETYTRDDLEKLL
ncbi:MAG: zeta toxin family protein [Patescibacteria group bacterium]|nr:zeta toxin family protein [Patescibacteria group bacterium]